MSRIGKKPIQIPEGVEVKIEGKKIIVKGSGGELNKEFPSEIKVEVKDGRILVLPQTSSTKIMVRDKKTNALWGLTRALIANMVKGITEGYEKKLEIEGLGFRANLEGDNLVLKVGFTHPVKLKAPEGIKFLVEKNVITISGADKQSVGEIAAKIRRVQPPEPYKGKGIRYAGEVIRKKVGKKAVTTTGG